MTRKGYRFAVDWIAWNDEPTSTDADDVRAQISTQLVADMFDKPAEVVARDVLRLRERMGPEEV